MWNVLIVLNHLIIESVYTSAAGAASRPRLKGDDLFSHSVRGAVLAISTMCVWQDNWENKLNIGFMSIQSVH